MPGRLHGHKLGTLGAGPGNQAAGISATNPKNIMVKNGTIRELYAGISSEHGIHTANMQEVNDAGSPELVAQVHGRGAGVLWVERDGGLGRDDRLYGHYHGAIHDHGAGDLLCDPRHRHKPGRRRCHPD